MAQITGQAVNGCIARKSKAARAPSPAIWAASDDPHGSAGIETGLESTTATDNNGISKRLTAARIVHT